MKRVLLADRIQLAIMMFEQETAYIVSSITMKRTPDGEVDVSVGISPRKTHYRPLRHSQTCYSNLLKRR